MLAASIYHATGSFQLAIHLTLSIAGALAFYAAGRLFELRTLGSRRASLCAASLLFFPTFLWKSVEFTSVAFYLPFLLLALGAAERKKWWQFLWWWALGMSTRQSALTWLAIPLVDFVRLARQNHQLWRRQTLLTALICLLGGGIFLCLRGTMNRTHSQRVITERVFEQIAPAVLLHGWIVGIAIFFGGVGLMAFTLLLRHRFRPARPDRWRTGSAMLLAGVIAAATFYDWISFDHPLLAHAIGHSYGVTVAVCILTGWLFAATLSYRGEYLIYAVANLGLVSLRPALWDYYFIDVAVFGIFSVTGLVPTPNNQPNRFALTTFRTFATALLVFGIIIVAELKCLLDRRYALCVLYEKALRDKRLEVAETNSAPFGLRGWYLAPWFIEHQGQESANFAGFEGYLKPDAVKVKTRYHRLPSRQLRTSFIPPYMQNDSIASGCFRFAWLFQADYFLIRSNKNSDLTASLKLANDYRREPFPLSDLEWRALINTSPWLNR